MGEAQGIAGLVAGLAVLAVGAHVARRWWMRRVMVGILSRQDPRRRDEAVDFARRAIPLWRRGAGMSGLPADPFALSVPVVVPPLGDGRPGESFRAPRAPIAGTDMLVADGSRTDAQLPLAAGVRFAVVCLGRVGAVRAGRVLLPAEHRVGLRRMALPAGMWADGAPTRVDSAAGPGWRQTFASASLRVTDTHLDRGGFAYVVGVSVRTGRPDLTGVVDAVLATWRWLDDPSVGAPVPPDGAPRGASDGATAPAEVVVHVGGPGRRGATFAAPAASVLPAGLPARTGVEVTEALLVLSPTAELAVLSAPLRAPARDRVAAGVRAPVVREPDGPAVPVAAPAGDGWRARYLLGSGFVSDEVELDHGDRAWTLVLARGPDDAAVTGALDRALASWRWRD